MFVDFGSTPRKAKTLILRVQSFTKFLFAFVPTLNFGPNKNQNINFYRVTHFCGVKRVSFKSIRSVIVF